MVSVEEFMTIGAFAKRTGLSVSAIRFYASQQLLVPAEVDSTSGYRRYAEDQVSDGILIRDLRRLEMPLSDIALALERTEPERKELVERHLRRLDEVVMRAHNLARTMGVANRPTENTMSATLQTVDLAGALDQILPAAGTDPELPHLMSVLIEVKDGSIRFVATDSFRLAIRDLVPSHLDGEFTAIVSAATLSEWRMALTEPAELALSLDEKLLKVIGHSLDLTASVLPITFPDYEKFLVPADNVTSVKTDRQRFMAALEGMEDDSTLSIATSEHSLRMSHDQRSVDIDAICEGPEQHVALNARFATDAARNAVGAEVVIEIEDSLSPLLFRSADDGTFTSRIMPIKLD